MLHTACFQATNFDVYLFKQKHVLNARAEVEKSAEFRFEKNVVSLRALGPNSTQLDTTRLIVHNSFPGQKCAS